MSLFGLAGALLVNVPSVICEALLHMRENSGLQCCVHASVDRALWNVSMSHFGGSRERVRTKCLWFSRKFPGESEDI